MAYSGRYHPTNPKKYTGDVTNIWYRSLWERKTMDWLDRNSNVLEWSSEELIIHIIDTFPILLQRLKAKMVRQESL